MAGKEYLSRFKEAETSAVLNGVQERKRSVTYLLFCLQRFFCFLLRFGVVLYGRRYVILQTSFSIARILLTQFLFICFALTEHTPCTKEKSIYALLLVASHLFSRLVKGLVQTNGLLCVEHVFIWRVSEDEMETSFVQVAQTRLRKQPLAELIRLTSLSVLLHGSDLVWRANLVERTLVEELPCLLELFLKELALRTKLRCRCDIVCRWEYAMSKCEHESLECGGDIVMYFASTLKCRMTSKGCSLTHSITELRLLNHRDFTLGHSRVLTCLITGPHLSNHGFSPACPLRQISMPETHH